MTNIKWLIAGLLFAALYTGGAVFLGYRWGHYGIDSLTTDIKQLQQVNDNDKKVVNDLEKQIADQLKQKEQQDQELQTAADILAKQQNKLNALQTADGKKVQAALTKPQCAALKEHLCPELLNY